jgi:RNA polymerase sigma-70 factor (ECF subfamily)
MLLRPKFGRRGVPSDWIDDLVQITLSRSVKTVQDGAIRSPEKLGGFVSKVGDYVYEEFKRNEVRREHDDLNGMDLPGNSPSPEEFVRQEEIKKVIAQVIVKLPARDKAILRAVFLEERDRDEICRQFKVERDHLRLLVHRALEKARKLLNGASGAGPRHEN